MYDKPKPKYVIVFVCFIYLGTILQIFIYIIQEPQNHSHFQT